LFIADKINNRVRRVDAVTGQLTTVVGTGPASSTGDGGAASAATLNRPHGLAFDGAGNLYVAEGSGDRIRKDGPGRAGGGTGAASSTGDGGAASAATLNQPSGVAFDSAGNLYVSERGGDRVRKVAPGADGLVTGAADETITTVAAGLGNPEMMGIDTAGMLLVSAQSSHVVLRPNPGTGAVRLAAGSGAANVGAGFRGGGPLATGL